MKLFSSILLFAVSIISAEETTTTTSTTTTAETTTTVIPQRACYDCSYKMFANGTETGEKSCLEGNENLIHTNITHVCYSSFKRTIKNGEIVEIEITRGQKDKKNPGMVNGQYHQNNTDVNVVCLDNSNCNGDSASDFITADINGKTTTTTTSTTTTTTTTTTTSTTTPPTTSRTTTPTTSPTTTQSTPGLRHARAVEDDETTTQKTTTTTPPVLNCYSCSQTGSDSTGDCWTPSDSTQQEVCDNGCIARMTQGFQSGSGFQTEVERTCSPADAPDTDETEEKFEEFFECENDLCNEFKYSSAEAAFLSSLVLLLLALF